MDAEPHNNQPASPGAPPEVTTALTCVDEITGESRGVWLLLTRHTIHVVDLDHHVYERRPGPLGSRYQFDYTPVRYSRIEAHPKVGSRMLLWFDDPLQPEFQEHYRYTAPIRAIMGWRGDTARVANHSAPDVRQGTPRPALEPHAADPNSTGDGLAAGQGYERIGDAGCWTVNTVNSDYLIDLDANTAVRDPVEPWPLRGDGHPVTLLEVVSAEVGRPLVLRLRHQGSATDTMRYGTTVLRITRS